MGGKQSCEDKKRRHNPDSLMLDTLERGVPSIPDRCTPGFRWHAAVACVLVSGHEAICVKASRF